MQQTWAAMLINTWLLHTVAVPTARLRSLTQWRYRSVNHISCRVQFLCRRRDLFVDFFEVCSLVCRRRSLKPTYTWLSLLPPRTSQPTSYPTWLHYYFSVWVHVMHLDRRMYAVDDVVRFNNGRCSMLLLIITLYLAAKSVKSTK